tara:strand:- start:2568 stop:2840 length:273 start_codon:yes stop_codon:yes gene_type:complete
MKDIKKILKNMSTECDPITLDCNAVEARRMWLDVASFREQAHLELCVQPLKGNKCIVYVESWDAVEETDATPYILIILTCFALGAILWMG